MTNFMTIKGGGGGISQAAVQALIDASIVSQNLAQFTTDAEVQTIINSQTFLNAIQGNIHVDILRSHAIPQGTWGLSLATTYYRNGLVTNSPKNLNDEINYLVSLAAGTYTLKFTSATSTDSAIAKFYLNADLVATFDLYSAATVRNTLHTQTGIVVATPGIKTLKVIAEDKNASSTAYGITLVGLNLYRTA